MTVALTLQILAAITGMVGATLLRKPSRWMPWAFVAWLISNPAAIALSLMQQDYWLAAMFSYYLVLAIESTFNWLVKPMLEDRGQ